MGVSVTSEQQAEDPEMQSPGFASSQPSFRFSEKPYLNGKGTLDLLSGHHIHTLVHIHTYTTPIHKHNKIQIKEIKQLSGSWQLMRMELESRPDHPPSSVSHENIE